MPPATQKTSSSKTKKKSTTKAATATTTASSAYTPPKLPKPPLTNVKKVAGDLKVARKEGYDAAGAQIGTRANRTQKRFNKIERQADRREARVTASIDRLKANSADFARRQMAGGYRQIGGQTLTNVQGRTAKAFGGAVRGQAGEAVRNLQKGVTAGDQASNSMSRGMNAANNNAMSILDVLKAEHAANDSMFLADLRQQNKAMKYQAQLAEAQMQQQVEMAEMQHAFDMERLEKQYELEAALLDAKEKKEAQGLKKAKKDMLSQQLTNHMSVGAAASSFVQAQPELVEAIAQLKSGEVETVSLPGADGEQVEHNLGTITQMVADAVAPNFVDADGNGTVTPQAISSIISSTVENTGIVDHDQVLQTVLSQDPTGKMASFASKHENLIRKLNDTAIQRAFQQFPFENVAPDEPPADAAPAGPGFMGNVRDAVESTPFLGPIVKTSGILSDLISGQPLTQTNLAYLGWTTAPYGRGPRLSA